MNLADSIQRRHAIIRDLVDLSFQLPSSAPRAETCLLEAIDLARGASHFRLESEVLLALAELHMRRQELAKSHIDLSEAALMSDRLQDPADARRLLSVRARLSIKDGDLESAIQLLTKAIDSCRTADSRVEEAKNRAALSEVLIALGRYAEAQAALWPAVKICDQSFFALQSADRWKVSLSETHNEVYELLQIALAASGKYAQALERCERNRARAFADLLRARAGIDPPAEQNPPDFAEICRIASETKSTIVEYSIVGGIACAAGDMAEERLMIWVVQPSGQLAFHSASWRLLPERRVPAATAEPADCAAVPTRGVGSSEMRVSSGESFLLSWWHQSLIEPVARFLPDAPEATVVLVLTGVLFKVPFPALQDQERRHLVEGHTLMFAPSVQSAGLMSSMPRTGTRNVLVMGDPEMPTLPGADAPLPALPGARNEAVRVAGKLGTTAVLGKQATKARFLAEAPGSSIIRLATHSVQELGPADLPGAIALAPSGDDAGFLTSVELMNLDLQACLVVLSACRTARGKITTDGVVGLSRSLMAAGARSVLTTLIEVPDDKASRLMNAFYDALIVYGDNAAALREAMLDALKAGELWNFWASFVLIGQRVRVLL